MEIYLPFGCKFHWIIFLVVSYLPYSLSHEQLTHKTHWFARGRLQIGADGHIEIRQHSVLL